MRSLRGWAAYIIIAHVPVHRISWRVYLWLLAYAGEWAYREDAPMSKCHGCGEKLEPIAQVRTYHTQCDPWSRMERLERALRSLRRRHPLAISDAELAEIDAVLTRPVQLMDRPNDTGPDNG